jgi:hypothetical protein
MDFVESREGGARLMSLFSSKLGFIHRRLWDRDGFYRIALLFGPAPLIGCGVAAGIWFMVRALPAPIVQPPDWGKPPQVAENWSTTGEPQTVRPARPIPPIGANGGLSGYEAGWRATIHAVEVSPTFNTEIKPTPLSAFSVDGPTIDLAPIIAAGTKDTKFVGTGSGFLVIRTPGTYALSLRFDRPAGPIADCLTRLSFGPHKVVSNFNLANPGNVSKTFDAAKFDLKPGLYSIGWVLGCWRDQETVGPGRITVLISHPGDQALQPARADEIVRLQLPAQVVSPALRDEVLPPSALAPRTPAIGPTAATGNSPHNATISLATPGGSGIDQTSGLDRALLGRTFQSTLLVNGFKVPLPPGQWAMLANGAVTGNAHPENKGMIYFLGQIVQKRVVAAMWVQAMRSPGLGFIQNQNCTNPANLYVLDEPEGTDHQGCTWIRSYFSADMQQWADKSAHIDQMARAAGGNLAAKGVSYPQELVTAGFQQAEKWGELSAGYMFSPEKNGISSNVVPTFRDSDWYKSNLQRYPEKVAYVNKLQQWATSFSPKFQAAFEGGKQTGD